MQIADKVVRALQSGPKSITQLNAFFGNDTRKKLRETLVDMSTAGTIRCKQVRRADGAGKPKTVCELADTKTVDFTPPAEDAPCELISITEFVEWMGSSSERNLQLQLSAHPKAPKPAAKVGALILYKRSDAFAFKTLVEKEKTEARQRAEETALRKHAQNNQDLNTLRQELNKTSLQLDAARRIADTKQQLADHRGTELKKAEEEIQRLSVTVNQNSKTIADLAAQVRTLEATKRKCLSFLAWLAQISKCEKTDDFDVMKAAIQATLEQSSNPDIEKLVSAYKSAAELSERNYQRISEQHLTLLDEYKKMKQDLSWFEILVEHCANFILHSQGIKTQLWATERANIWRTLHVMGKLKK